MKTAEKVIAETIAMAASSTIGQPTQDRAAFASYSNIDWLYYVLCVAGIDATEPAEGRAMQTQAAEWLAENGFNEVTNISGTNGTTSIGYQIDTKELKRGDIIMGNSTVGSVFYVCLDGKDVISTTGQRARREHLTGHKSIALRFFRPTSLTPFYPR